MKIFKVFFYSAFFMSFYSVAFSLGSIHIAVLESPALIEESPFAARVHVMASPPMEVNNVDDPEFEEHGVAVCSVLVGKRSSLPEETSITLVPDLNQFSSYVMGQKSDDLVLLNWSGSTGYPGLPEDLVEELEDIFKHFNSIIEMNETDFTANVDAYMKEYEELLKQLPSAPNPLADLLNYAKESLLEVKNQPKRPREVRGRYSSEMRKKIDNFKQFGEEQSKLQFGKMKTSLLETLRQHDNTLIIWALGNDGACIDQDPFWHALLTDDLILSHTLLVYGLNRNGQRDGDSNFTDIYSEHSLGRPYSTWVWSIESGGFIQENGTSFSTPLATIDAFLKAKELFERTGKTPSHVDVKCALIRK